MLKYALLLWRIALTIRSYINCYDVSVRRAEMTPIILIVLCIIAISKKFEFSPLAYIFMSVLLYMHTIGAHYTFERVPFDRFSDLFGFERNHYDRIAHFSVGTTICCDVWSRRMSWFLGISKRHPRCSEGYACWRSRSYFC